MLVLTRRKMLWMPNLLKRSKWVIGFIRSYIFSCVVCWDMEDSIDLGNYVRLVEEDIWGIVYV